MEILAHSQSIEPRPWFLPNPAEQYQHPDLLLKIRSCKLTPATAAHAVRISFAIFNFSSSAPIRARCGSTHRGGSGAH
ncbi:unnamed protein product [Dibothriocephalus latus]|uniref:Uncharacterized protein n=1 Tax=Dibothriocephalus latus TaxID=60516 RepID=A0A3P7M3W7_DIBLA|nr:unnamed protein product [Dibothriocephalus latus]